MRNTSDILLPEAGSSSDKFHNLVAFWKWCNVRRINFKDLASA